MEAENKEKQCMDILGKHPIVEIAKPKVQVGEDGKKKRTLVKWTTEQKQLLETLFQIESFPQKALCQKIATRVGFPTEKVKTWFMNRRAKDRRKEAKESGLEKTVGKKKAPKKKKKKEKEKVKKGSKTPKTPSKKKATKSPKKKSSVKRKAKSTPAQTPPRKKRRVSDKMSIEEEMKDLIDIGYTPPRTSRRRTSSLYFKSPFGLPNPSGSNYCFINSVLQALFHTEPFARYFLSKCYLEDLKEKKKITHGFRETLGNLLVEAQEQGKTKLDNLSLILAICELNKWIRKDAGLQLEQEDADELLGFLLEQLATDLEREGDSKPRNIISDCFEGKMVSTIQCLECQKTRPKVETFKRLKLHLQKPDTVRFQYTLIDSKITVPTMKKECDIPRKTNSVCDLIRKHHSSEVEPGADALVMMQMMFQMGKHGMLHEVDVSKNAAGIASTPNIVFIRADQTKHAGGGIPVEVYFQFEKPDGELDKSLYPRIWCLPKVTTKKKLMIHLKSRLSHLVPKNCKPEDLFDIDIFPRGIEGVAPDIEIDNGKIVWPEEPAVMVLCGKEMQKIYAEKKRNLNKVTSRRTTLKVQNLVERFGVLEFLDSELECESCKTKTKSTKQSRIQSLPKYLVMTLVRFKEIGLEHGKDESLVQCPFKLDMSEFVTDVEESLEYKLYATIQHHGDLGAGHYFAHILPKGAKSWKRVDDDMIATLTTDKVVTKETYILFYERL